MYFLCKLAKRFKTLGIVRPSPGLDIKFSSTNIIPTNLFELGRADVDERQKVNLFSLFDVQEVPFGE